MRNTLSLFVVALLALASTSAPGADFTNETGPGEGTLVGQVEGGCGTLVFYADGTYENGYTWSYGGIVAPDYGAFAECFDGPAKVCSAVADLTSLFEPDLQYPVDVYVYDDDGGIPGAVVASSLGNDAGGIAIWPSVSRHVFPIETACLGDRFYVGVWWDGSSGFDPNFIAADLDGFGGGCTLTKVAPGIGYPTGWQNVSVVWGPTQAIGLGAELLPCDPTPTVESSWGRIKSLY